MSGCIPTHELAETQAARARPYVLCGTSSAVKSDEANTERLRKLRPLRAGPMVRIRFPPAESQVRTCLSREFAFLRREAAVFRGCAGRGKRRGRERRAGHGNIGPTSGNISESAVGTDRRCRRSVRRSAVESRPAVLSLGQVFSG